MKLIIRILFIAFVLAAYPCSSAELATFIENKGQWAPEVLYFAEYRGVQYWITENSIIVDSYTFEEGSVQDSRSEFVSYNNLTRAGSVIKLEFQNSSLRSVEPIGKSEGYYNFILGNNPSCWTSNVRSYSKINLKSIYKGIDLQLYFEERGLRHDFHLEPDADPSLINYKISGSESIDVDEEGKLNLATPSGKVIIAGLAAFSEAGGTSKPVGCSFRKLSPNSVSFNLDSYDKTQRLIIDPLIYSTFIGGAKFDQARDIEILESGEVYLTGSTLSKDFPTSIGAYSKKMKDTNSSEIFVTKLDSSGKNLLFSTYIGGHFEDVPEGLEIDAAGYVFVAGCTGGAKSNNFPVTANAWDTVYNGGYDAFVLKLRYDGTRLEYSTFIGGKFDDFAQSLVVDNGGYAYITGYTTEDGMFPTTEAAFGRVNKGGYDAFITKLTPNGSNVPISTLIAGNKDDFGNDIDLDEQGNIYIVGTTRSTDFPISTKTWDRTYNDTIETDESGDIFVTVIEKWGRQLLFSTYLGGRAKERAYGIRLDSKENIIVAGYSESSDYPVTKFVFDTTYNSIIANKGKGDAVITKLRKLEGDLVFSTYFGGTGTDKALDLYLDSYDNCFITGVTGSVDFPVSFNGYDTSYNEKVAGADAFVIKTDADGRRIHYGSYYGGSGNDVGQSIKVYNGVYIYLAGTTSSANFPVSAGAFDTQYTDSLGSEAFVIKDMPYYMIVDGGNNVNICLGDTAQLGSYAIGGSGQITYKWEPTQWLSNPTDAFTNAWPPETTTYTLTATDGSGYSYSDEVVVGVMDYPQAQISGKTKIVKNGIYTYSATYNPSYGYSWIVSGGEIIYGDNTNTVLIKWTNTDSAYVSLVVDNGNACYDSLSAYNIKIENINLPGFDYSDSLKFCEGGTLTLTARDGYAEYHWSNGTTGKKLVITESGRYWLDAVTANGHESSSDTIDVTVYPKPPMPTVKDSVTSSNEEILVCSVEGMYYQWFYGSDKILFATNRTYKPYLKGYFTVVITDKHACQNSSAPHPFKVAVDDGDKYDRQVRLYPNPAAEEVNLEIVSPDMELYTFKVAITDILGNTRYKKDFNIQENTCVINIGISDLEPGSYYLTLSNINRLYYFKLVVVE